MEFVSEAPSVPEECVQTWTIGADPLQKNEVIDEVIQYLSQRFTLGPSTLFQYRLCLDEAITNSITHGCKGLAEAAVGIEFFFGENCWVLRISDSGPGFDPKSLPDPNDPDSPLQEQGRGILILERYTERLVFSEGGCVQTIWMAVPDA